MYFEHWKSCPVRYATQMKDGECGYYDKEHDRIVINLDGSAEYELEDVLGKKYKIVSPFNPLITYLMLLFYRDYHEKETSEWIAEQSKLMWDTMSTTERWELGLMLFNNSFDEEDE